MVNDYYAEVTAIPEENRSFWSNRHQKFVKKYGWTIPTPAIISYLQNSLTGTLHNIGCGKGYCSMVFEENNISIASYDISVPEETYVQVIPRDVLQQQHTFSNQIFIGWPPADSSFIQEFCNIHTPEDLYLIGKQNSSITGQQQKLENILPKYTIKETLEVPSFDTDRPTVFTHYSEK